MLLGASNKGRSLLLFGSNDDGAYAYFNTERALGCILEALEMLPSTGPTRTRANWPRPLLRELPREVVLNFNDAVGPGSIAPALLFIELPTRGLLGNLVRGGAGLYIQWHHT